MATSAERMSTLRERAILHDNSEVPLDADLATLVDAPPRLAASAGGLFVSVNSAGAAGATGLTLVLGSVGVDSRDIQVYCRT